MWLARCCLVLVFGLPVAVLAYWLTADTIGLAVQARLDDLVIQQPLALWQRLAGAGVTLLSLGLLLGGLWQVRRCFQRFAAGHYFELATIRHLRRFAALTCASVVVSFVCTPVLSVLLTLNNAPGHRQLALGVSSEQLFTLFIAGMVWLIAAVMTHASSLAEENAQFV
ncbi:MAG: DUF2975 domain-containing protein [Moraxellaceae bacterium]|nr:DUF2975 domain-containing protein [Moraxellaceae bacterium]